MKTGFSAVVFEVATSDGRNFVLLEPVTYTAQNGEVITIPAGSTSDGASTPPALWPSIPPFGKYWPAAFLHDYLYRCTALPKTRCDALLLEAMESLGVWPIEARTIYEGVALAGRPSFTTDRQITENVATALAVAGAVAASNLNSDVNVSVTVSTP